MIFGLVCLAILIGTLMPAQAGLNAQLTRFMGHPFMGAFISLTTGAIIMAILILFKDDGMTNMKRLSSAPLHLLLGGVFGAIFVFSSLFFIPRMGATLMMSSFIAGQMIGSLLIDHYGLLGVNPSPVTLTKITGVFLLFGGVFLMIRKQA